VKKLISANVAGNILLVSMGLLAIFHILVLLNFVPPDLVWGGQIGVSTTNLLVLEIIALLVTAVFAMIIAAKVGYIGISKFKKATTVGAWILFAFLILNTVGNLASGVSVENLVFAPITLILAFCALRLAIEP
jgi:hypothetical protein